MDGLPFTVTLSSHLQSKPKTIFRVPFLAEMVFAGFDKSKGCRVCISCLSLEACD
jgi:DNA ligase-4